MTVVLIRCSLEDFLSSCLGLWNVLHNTWHAFEDGLAVSKQGIHRNGDLCSFLSLSAVSHPRELQLPYWTKSGLVCVDQALEEAVFTGALLKPGRKSVSLSAFRVFYL